MNQKIWCFLGVHSYGPEKDGKVTCAACGKIEVVPCAHVWKEHSTVPIFRGDDKLVGHHIVLKCEKCGELVNHTIRADKRY